MLTTPRKKPVATCTADTQASLCPTSAHKTADARHIRPAGNRPARAPAATTAALEKAAAP